MLKMRVKGWFLALLIVLTGLYSFSGKSKVENVVSELRNDPVLKGSTLGFVLKDLSNDSIVYAWNPDKPLVPASSQKLFTCAIAMDILGSDYYYRTDLIHTGTFTKETGTIDGDLIIQGSGDPTWDSKSFVTEYTENKRVGDLQAWVKSLTEMGLKEIKGKVVADASIFEDSLAAPGWPEQDLGNYYAAGAAGINYLDNSYRLFFKTGKTGTKASLLYSEPRIPGMTFISDVKAQGNGDNAFIIGKEYTYERKITGTLPPLQEKYDIDGSIPDPAAYCAYVLDSLLNAAGIKTASDLKGGLAVFRSTKSVQGTVLFNQRSPYLSTIVEKCLYHSHNLYAEAILKTIAVKVNGKGTRVGGVKIIKDWMLKKGIVVKDFGMQDGSGLSPENKITPRQFTDMLGAFAKCKAFNHFWPGLRKHRLHVFSKSGYISGVRSYCGYVKTDSGKMYSFALILNQYTCSAKVARINLEKVLNTLEDLP